MADNSCEQLWMTMMVGLLAAIIGEWPTTIGYYSG